MNSVEADIASALPTVGRDLVDIFTSRDVALLLVGQAATTELTDSFGLGRASRKYFADHSVYSDQLSGQLEQLGAGHLLLAGAGTWYFIANGSGNTEAVGASKRLMRSLASTGIATVALKGLFPDTRPNGGSHSFPSGHTSMAVTAASSLWYSYGYEVGLPASILASLVAVQRLDSQAHDLDDVLAGATLGWIVARSLSGQEPLRVFGASVLPNFDPNGGSGITLSWNY